MSDDRKKYKLDELITAQEAADYLEVGKTKFHADIKPQLEPYEIGGRGKKYKVADLNEYKEQCKKIKIPTPEPETNLKNPSQAPTLKSAKTARKSIVTTSQWKGRALEDLRGQVTYPQQRG